MADRDISLAPPRFCLRDGQAWAFHSATGTVGMQLEWTLYMPELPDNVY